MNEQNYIWHRTVNEFHDDDRVRNQRVWMYEAISLFKELPRLKRLFAAERKKLLSKLHVRSSRSEPEEIKENTLTCCLGIECGKCPELRALEEMDLLPEEIDERKAHTCATHILMSAAKTTVDTSGGYVLTGADRRFWRSWADVLESFVEK